MLLVLEGQTGEFWEPSYKQRAFGNRKALQIGSKSVIMSSKGPTKLCRYKRVSL